MPIFLSIPRAANGAENRDNAGGLFITVDVILVFLAARRRLIFFLPPVNVQFRRPAVSEFPFAALSIPILAISKGVLLSFG